MSIVKVRSEASGQEKLKIFWREALFRALASLCWAIEFKSTTNWSLRILSYFRKFLEHYFQRSRVKQGQKDEVKEDYTKIFDDRLVYKRKLDKKNSVKLRQVTGLIQYLFQYSSSEEES